MRTLGGRGGGRLKGWKSEVDHAQASIEVPERADPLQRIFTDDANRLWIQRVAVEGEPTRFDAFRQDGEFIGSVLLDERLPRYSEGVVVRNDNLYAVVLGDLDVQAVVRAPLPGFIR